MVRQELIDELNREYDRSEGFLGRLRDGVFDPIGAENLVRILSSIELNDGPVDRRLVQLLWFLPVFLQWQKERIHLQGGDVDDVESLLNRVVTTLEDVLGVP